MTTISSREFTVYPDDCDSFGHLNQASFLLLFERARWDALAAGPGMDAFARHKAWPAIRKANIEYHRQVLPGDRLRLELELTHLGRSSFQMRQVARKVGEDAPVAEATFLFVCIGQDGRPTMVPPDVAAFFGGRPSRRTGVARHVSVKGLVTAVEVHGDGPAILLIHGFPLERTVWRQVSAMLTGWRRIEPDLRGCGLTEVPESGYSMQQYADDMAGLLDTLHVERTVVCGLSMGGYIAFEMLRRHAGRVRGLILLNTRASADDADGRAKRDATIARVRRDGTGFLADEMMGKLLAPSSLKTMPEVVDQVRTMVTNNPADGMAGALEAMRDRPDSTPLLAEITVPTLVIAGSHDRLIPTSVAKAMADAIPGAQYSVIPAAGHLAPLEQPVNTARVIREFLEALG